MITIIKKYILIVLITAYSITGAQRLWVIAPEHVALQYWKNFDFDTAIIKEKMIEPSDTSSKFQELKELIRGIPKNTPLKHQEDEDKISNLVEPHAFASHAMTEDGNGAYLILPLKKNGKRGYFVAEVLKENTIFSLENYATSADILNFFNMGIFVDNQIFTYTQIEP